jgi:arsenate reductase (thioredoxin)
MADRPYNVLFLCTGNSARSIIAEAILNKTGKGAFRAYSAGSQPKGQVSPHALQLLKSLGYETAGFRSKSWDEFAKAGAPKFDFVFTVCDNAAAEACPVWPGQPMTAHWGIADPAEAKGTPAQVSMAFKEAYRLLNQRIGIFTSLPLRSLDRLTLKAKLRGIGEMEGATKTSERT